MTDWDTWRREHPGTLALDAVGGRSGFDVDDTFLAIEFNGRSLAVPVADLREVGVANVEVAGVPVAVVAEPVPGGWWAVYSRQLDDRVVSLRLEGGTLVEVDGRGRWGGVRGLPEEGSERLDPLGALTIFPSDFEVHFPDGQVWTP